MAESESFLRASLPRDIDLVFERVPDGASVVAEPAQLQQIILNLCSNAAQAMQGHGCIDVETTHVDLTERRDLTHGVVKSGCYVVIAVTDTGPGIDDADLKVYLTRSSLPERPVTGLGWRPFARSCTSTVVRSM